MIKKIPSSNLYVSQPNPSWFGNDPNEKTNPKWTNSNWLKSRFHFSFAEYSNHRNTNFGVLRVLNDDLVQPNRGFGEHPHRDVEICTYVVEGSLTHQDSMGTQETLGRGAIQFMTAGRGVEHSEHNLDKEKPLRFLQLWINTRKRGLPPKYGSFSGSLEDRKNRWSHMVSDVNSDFKTPIKINQDANIFVTELDACNGNDDAPKVTYTLDANRQIYLVCIEGNIKIDTSSDDNTSDTVLLQRHDAAEIVGPLTFTVQVDMTRSLGQSATETSESLSEHVSAGHVLLVEMAKEGKGRSDL